MDTETTTTFFALLAILAQAAVVVAILLAVAGRFVPAIGQVRSRAAAVVAPQAVGLAAVVALVCTLGSLYLSEVAEFVPCRLCWYQRAAMYPLVVVLPLAAVTGRRGLRILGAALATVGGAVSIFHILVERYPSLESSTSCDPTNPCSIVWVEHFGYLTIPTMALSGFALVLTLLAIAGSTTTQEHP